MMNSYERRDVTKSIDRILAGGAPQKIKVYL
jgi:hypothetical protein